jgi:hypothetical protein
MHDSIGIDIKNTLFCYLDLVASYRAMCRNQLSVDIAFGNLVAIYDGKCSDATARECFDDIRSYAPNTKNADMRALQFVDRIFSEKLCGTAILFFHP